jgi:hypothetical protein
MTRAGLGIGTFGFERASGMFDGTRLSIRISRRSYFQHSVSRSFTNGIQSLRLASSNQSRTPSLSGYWRPS